MLTGPKIKYLIQLLAPVFFLPLLVSGTLIVIPSIIFNLVSTFCYQTNLRYHYTSLIIPVFAWGALLYIRRVKDFGARRALAVAILLATLLSSYLWGPADWSPQAVYRYDPKSPQARAAAEAAALIPEDAVVAARSRLTTHFTHRDKVYDFPTPFYSTYYGDDSMRGQRLPVADQVEYVLDTPESCPQKGPPSFRDCRMSKASARSTPRKESCSCRRWRPAPTKVAESPPPVLLASGEASHTQLEEMG